MESPNTRFKNYHTKVAKRKGTRNPRKHVLISKVVNPFTHALAPSFIGRRRDFCILRLPSNLKNILSVNMCMNVFYIPWFAGLISYIYKTATSSHLKPGLFEMTSLTWQSINPRSLIHADPHSSRLANLRFPNIPEVRSVVHVFMNLSCSRSLQIHDSMISPDSIRPETDSRSAIQKSIRWSSRSMLEN
jgi:hypothetical protein